jgi:hypothetical protein
VKLVPRIESQAKNWKVGWKGFSFVETIEISREFMFKGVSLVDGPFIHECLEDIFKPYALLYKYVYQKCALRVVGVEFNIHLAEREAGSALSRRMIMSHESDL